MWARCAYELDREYDIFTGTYDSFYLLVPDAPSEIKVAQDFMEKVMTQKWPELDNWSFPIDMAIGYNWGKYDKDTNPFGLKEL